MQQPFFSIIITVFNGGKTIGKALNSVADQTYKFLEVVIIDGGSTDNTLQIIKEYKQVTHFVSEPDKGIYDGMNKGVKAAKGNWIYFLGADDYLYDENVLQNVAVTIESCNCDMLYGNVFTQDKVYDGYFDIDKLLRTNISHQAIFYSSKLFNEVGLYNIRYRTHADWEFNIRCFLHERIKVHFIDVIVAYFTFGGASSRHDVACLREVILPRKLRLLKDLKPFQNIETYDEWWRLIRNSKTKSLQQLVIDSDQDIVKPVSDIIRFQSIVPARFIRIGVFSKSLMFISYCFTQIKILLKWI